MHAFKYGETSLITEIYTEEMGFRKYIVSGVRTRKPRFSASLFQEFTPVDLVVYQREDKDLNRMKEARPAWVLEAIPFEHRRGAVALFMAELVRKTVRESEKNPALFAFLFRAIRVLDSHQGSLVNLPLYFMVQLTIRLGFQPHGTYTEATPYLHMQEGIFSGRANGHRYILEPALGSLLCALLESTWSEFGDIRAGVEERRSLMDQLLVYYQLHLEHFHGLNSPEILRRVFS